MKKLIYIAILTSVFASNAQAQQLPLFSQYYYNKFLYNPAFTGTEDNANAYLIHRSQWKDIPGAPVTYALTADGPVKNKEIGLGLSLFNDQIDIFNRTGLYTSYSYRIKLATDHDLTLGVSAGVIDNKIDFSRANAHDANDPLLYNENQRKITMDASFGIGYFWKDLYVGVSMPQILGNKVKYLESNTNVYTTLKRHLVGSIGYKVTLSESNEIDFLPSAMVRYVKGAPFQFDINANFAWKDMVRAGVSYRFGYALGFNIGTKLNGNLIGGYTYEYVLSPIGSFSGGGHEIMLGYSFGKSKSSGDNADIEKLNKQIEESSIQNDSILREMKKKDVEHTEEIEKLKNELENLKKDGTTGQNTVKDSGNVVAEVKDKSIRTENAADYTDEDGKTVAPGYYVIMGAFKSKENAAKAKKEFASKGAYKPSIIYNKQRGFYYVNVFHNTDEDTALNIMEVLKKEQPDAWVFNMQ